MSIVTINNEWRIDIDEWNHTLERYSEGGKVIPNGKYVGQLTKAGWSAEGYYPNVKQCLQRVCTLVASEGGDIDLNAYIQKLEWLYKEYGGVA